MNNSVSTTVKDQPPEGPVVAVQYPSTVKFDSAPGIGKELATKYSHLQRLDIEDKEGYAELKEAIKYVVTKRTDNQKQEDVIKGPLNTFRQLVIDTGKKIRNEIKDVESTLTKEKARIDNIVAENLAKQQRLWAENLQIVHAKGQNLVGADLEHLENELAIIDLFKLSDFDFGELEEEAKAGMANARIRVEQAIAQEEGRLELIAQQEKLAKEREELEAKQEAERLEAMHAEGLAMNDNHDLKATLAASVAKLKAAEAAAKPEPEPELPENSSFVKDDEGEVIGVSTGIKMGDEQFADAVMGGSGEPLADGLMKVHQAIVSAAADTSDFDDDTPAPAAPVICDQDKAKIDGFIDQLRQLSTNAPVDFENQNLNRAVDRMALTLSNAADYLAKVKKGE